MSERSKKHENEIENLTLGSSLIDPVDLFSNIKFDLKLFDLIFHLE